MERLMDGGGTGFRRRVEAGKQPYTGLSLVGRYHRSFLLDAMLTRDGLGLFIRG